MSVITSTGSYTPGDPERFGFYRFARFLMRLICALFFKLDIQGLDTIPVTGPIILASNHLSSWDIFATAIWAPRMLHFMAKAEYAKNAFMRHLFGMVQSFFVRRGEGDTEAIRHCLAILKAGQALIIYPEGHRSDGHALIEAKDGFALIAYKSGVPIIPVATWGGELAGKDGRFLFRRPTVHVRFGAPFTFVPAGKRYTREELQQGTETTMRAIAAMLPESYRGFYSDTAIAARQSISAIPAPQTEK